MFFFFPGWMLRTISEPTLLRFAYIDWGLILRYFDGGSAVGSHWASHSACEIGFLDREKVVFMDGSVTKETPTGTYEIVGYRSSGMKGIALI